VNTRTATTVAACLGLLAGPTVHASGPDLFGFGARGQALAGAIAATAEGFESVYYNPAGLAFDKRPTFTLGYQYAAFDLEIDGEAVDVRDAPALTVGFGVPLPLGGIMKDRLALGLGFVIPQSSILIADLPKPGALSFPLLENRAQTVSLQATLGVRITDWWSIGVGTLALASLVGDIRVEPNASGRIGSKVRDELIADYSLVVGTIVKPLPELSIGLTWRTESRADFDLPITADLGSQFPVPIPQLAVNGTAQYDPAEVVLEVAGRPLPWLLTSAQVAWEGWSSFPLPLAYSATPEGYPPQPAPDFRDVWSVRVGIEGDFTLGEDIRLLPRLGWHLAPSPVPAQTGFHNHLDNTRHLFALGAGLRIDVLRVDFALQYHHLVPRSHTKGADIADTHPGFPSVAHEGGIFFGSLQVGVEL
jgi:long-chain fatty acid transport protein